MSNARRRSLKLSTLALSTMLLFSPLSANAALTIYNGQHKTATLALIDAFTEHTHIKVETRQGSSNELAHQIVEEGKRSPADIIYTEESTPLIMLANQGLLATLDDQALNNIPAEYRDQKGQWVGLLARSRVIAYNKDRTATDKLPTSVYDLTDAKWKDQFAFVKTSGAFQKQLSAMIKLDGREQAKAWLEGLQKNGKEYRNNKAALDAVERGDIPFALINNYYWDSMAREQGADKLKSGLYFMGTHDLGDLITVSGAAILKSSNNLDEAQQFMAFATSEAGQQILTDKSAQYPLNSKVDTHGLKPFSELTPPNDTLDLGEYSDGKAAIELLQEVGLL
ncbi:iron ABC transporter substrate-binding protein [Oceanisphaera profunda]|uniref:Iron ABC transporter substrate-binding protein n=1 Tax=Oceanisphaera profunda TaxID=1416627 RepID=A0A1Y0D181_9GAMM|nr:extracellular solute-binding protein [Oceanisphaera profunda]ART81273.1 iron ABC transporter substrate-binding protein [Oceanisphaera profunda]